MPIQISRRSLLAVSTCILGSALLGLHFLESNGVFLQKKMLEGLTIQEINSLKELVKTLKLQYSNAGNSEEILETSGWVIDRSDLEFLNAIHEYNN